MPREEDDPLQIHILYPGDGNPCIEMTSSGEVEAYGTKTGDFTAIWAMLYRGEIHSDDLPDEAPKLTATQGAQSNCSMSGIDWCFEGSNVIHGAQGNCSQHTLCVWGEYKNREDGKFTSGYARDHVYFRAGDESGSSSGSEGSGSSSRMTMLAKTPRGANSGGESPVFSIAPQVYEINYSILWSKSESDDSPLVIAQGHFGTREESNVVNVKVTFDKSSPLQAPIWEFRPKVFSGVTVQYQLRITRRPNGSLEANLFLEARVGNNGVFCRHSWTSRTWRATRTTTEQKIKNIMYSNRILGATRFSNAVVTF